MATRPIPFASQSYMSRSRPLSAQRCVNLFLEIQKSDAKVPLALFKRPGLRLFGTLGRGPIRAMTEMGGSLYAVSGGTVYRVDRDGVGTELGNVPAVGAAWMAAGVDEVLVVAGGTGYVATTDGLEPITSDGWQGATSAAQTDGYYVLTKPGSAEFYISAINDAGTYDPLDYAAAEASPDQLVRAVVDHRELWLFGERSIEIWYNSGAADFPFERVSGAFVERGLAAAGTVARLDNSLYWLGDDRVVYKAEAYTPVRVSTHAIEHHLSKIGDVSNARAFSFSLEGHAFYLLTIPNVITLVYDASTNTWAEWASKGRSDLRVWSHTRCYGRDLVGDVLDGRIYETTLDAVSDDGAEIIWLADSPPIWADGRRVLMSSLVVEVESGVGLSSGQGDDPDMALSWSDDGGRSWSPERRLRMGRIGEYRHRARWNRLGSFRERVLRLTGSDPVRVVILGAYGEIEGGRLI